MGMALAMKHIIESQGAHFTVKGVLRVVNLQQDG